MDNVTHSLVGYTLARAGLGRGTPAAALTLVLASNAPDIDIIAAFSGGRLAYLEAHRGATHGLASSLAVGALVASVVAAMLGWRAWRGGTRLPQPGRLFARLWLLASFGALLHVLMDLPTAYGTRIFAPFGGTWYALDWLPIIDVYLWALLAGGLAVGYLRPAASAKAAMGVLLLIGVNYAVRAGLHQAALTDATRRTADGVRAECATRPTWVRHPSIIEAAVAGPDSCIRAAALPTFLSPFTWRAVRQYPGGYELSQRSLLDGDTAAPRAWIPSDSGPLIARARATETGRVFLDFARFPAARIVQTSPGEVVVRVADVRFMGDPLRFDPDARPRGPFVLHVVLDPGGAVLDQRLGD